MRLIHHPEAEAELLEAVQSYEGKARGLGDRFLQEFDAAIVSIQESPDRWRVVGDDVQRFLLRRFPYGIYYRTQRDELRILVIKHHSRHPDYGKDRLGQ